MIQTILDALGNHFNNVPNNQLVQVANPNTQLMAGTEQLGTRTNITLFMLLYAPAITIGLFKTCNSSILDAIQLKIHTPDAYAEGAKSSIITLFFKKYKQHNLKKNNLNYQNRMPNKKYYQIIKLILLILVIIFCLYDLDYLFKIISKISYSKLLFFTIILGFLYVFYLTIKLLILILFIKNKIKIPHYIPAFFYQWLLTLYKISTFTPSEVRSFTDLFTRDLIINIIALTATIIIYLLLN